MRNTADGLWWKVACLWLCVSLRETIAMPLLGPHVMSFDSVSPFIEWQGPAQDITSTLLTPSAGEAGTNGPGAQGNIIKAPCVRGRMDVSGCREVFNFPQRIFRDNPQIYMRRQRGGPFPGRRIGRGRFPFRREPETPEPEQIRDD